MDMECGIGDRKRRIRCGRREKIGLRMKCEKTKLELNLSESTLVIK